MASLFRILGGLVRTNKLINFLRLFFRKEELPRPAYEFFVIRSNDHPIKIVTVGIMNVLSNVMFIMYLVALTVFYVICISSVAIFLRFKTNVAGYTSDEHFMKYLKIYWNRPGYFYHKLLEGLLFSKVEMRSPSMEVGISSGHGVLVSDLHFPKAQFDVGTEYNVWELKSLPMSDKHDSTIGLDARNMPIKDGVFQTICAVHSFDHFPEIEEALKECQRILKPKGHLVFSLCSEESPKVTLTYLFSRLIFPKKRAYAMAIKIKNKGYTYNFFSKQKWEKMLNSKGYHIRDYRMFLGGWVKYLLLFTSKFHRFGALIIPNNLSKRNIFAKNIIRKYFFFVNASLFYPSFKKEKGKMILNGRELFIMAEKTKRLSIQVNPLD